VNGVTVGLGLRVGLADVVGALLVVVDAALVAPPADAGALARAVAEGGAEARVDGTVLAPAALALAVGDVAPGEDVLSLLCPPSQ
jgi:hypothetical protein